MRMTNLLSALLAPGAGHVRAGRVRRGLVWIALMLLSLPTVRWTPCVPLLVWLAHVADAGLISEGDDAGPGAVVVGLAGYLFLVGGALLTRAHWIEMFKVSSGSMIPSLQVDDHFAVDKTVHHPRRGDVVIFPTPREPDKQLAKRVIAVGGDTVEIRENVIILNGQPVPRRHVDGACVYEDSDDAAIGAYSQHRCDAWEETLDGHDYGVIFDGDGYARSMAPRTVPAGEVFVLGDNRDNSYDSRHFGFIAERDIAGRATYIWWSRHGVHWPWQQRRVP